MAGIEDLRVRVGLTNEMLEQIRTIVREEITATLGVLTDEKHILARKLYAGLISLDEYKTATCTPDASITDAREAKRIADDLLKCYEPLTRGQDGLLAAPLTAQLEYEGKIYEGVLYFVKNADS